VKAVLDANVVVSGIIKEEGPPGQILRRLFHEEQFVSVTSLEILSEIKEVLGRGKIRKYHGWTDDQIDSFIVFMYVRSVVTESELSVNVIAGDPADNKFLACAQEGRADYLVSGDDHLLALTVYEGTRIISPAAFLSILQSA
jgi:putative PIN family toxin of toxin-antitoxin system